jgi:tetratricopeptide (TPR) repeat protein
MHTCSLCRTEIPEAPPQRWTTDDGESALMDQTAVPCAVVDTSVGEITVCETCYTQRLPEWLTDEDLQSIHYQFALEYRDHSEHQRSIQCLERALALGQSADILSALGYAYDNLAAPERAIEQYRRALELNPAHFIARENLNRLTNRCS